MIYIDPNRFLNDIRANLWKLNAYQFTGVIGIPRSGMIAATIIAEHLNIGLCSMNEYMSSNGDDNLFSIHGVRAVKHNNTNIYLVVDDTCCHGTMGEKMHELKKRFPDKIFVSAVVHIDGPCEKYKPDICLVDLRKDPDFWKDPKYITFHYYNILNTPLNSYILFDLDGVLCLDPPDDRDTKAYEDYLKSAKPLYIPVTTPDRPIDICTYRLAKYEKETRTFLKLNNINVGKLMMFPAASREVRNLTSSAYYKAQHYKDNKYFLFFESNDQEAQQICALTGKPVYCYQTGKFYKYNK